MITPDTWRDPDFHWEPSESVTRPFDIVKGARGSLRPGSVERVVGVDIRAATWHAWQLDKLAERSGS